MRGWLRGVSSVVRERRSGGVADVAGWRAWAFPGPLSTGMEYARLLDARSVAAGRVALEEFKDVWRSDPYEILAQETNPPGGESVSPGENEDCEGMANPQNGEFAPNRIEGC